MIQEPLCRSTLLVARYDTIARDARAFARLLEVDTCHIHLDIVDIAISLTESFAIEASFAFARFVVLDPFAEVGNDELEVLHTVISSLDGIVAQIFGEA